MSFQKPVFIGDEVSCYCRVDRIGRTSITVHIETWARARLDGDTRKVTEGKFTYVAIDENRSPIPVIREKF
jgi:acyl-CoA thioesterase YciA